MQGIGDIDYSLNKKKLNNILSDSSYTLMTPYFIVVFLSMIYIYSIRIQQYFDSKDDLLMRSLIRTYAIEGRAANGKPTGKFFLDFNGVKGVSKEVV